MNTVQPIRDKEIVRDIAEYLKKDSERNYVMFELGIYSGLRISDILKLRVRDVKNKKYITVREQKTGKEKRFPVNKSLIRIIASYVADKEDWEYIVSHPTKHKAISRQQAYNILSSAGERFGIEQIGTHTMRKTCGYHMYRAGVPADVIMKLFNHSDIQVTLRYIGIEQDTIDSAMNKLKF